MSHPLLERLASRDAKERATACRDAAGDPSAALLLDALADALGDPESAVARAAAETLADLGRRLSGVDAVLRRRLRGDVPARRWGAAFALARIAPPGPELLPPLVEALGSGAGGVRWTAAQLLVESGHAVAEILPLLLGLAAADERPLVRRMAIHCLRALAPEDPRVAQVVLDASRSADRALRRASLSTLAGLRVSVEAVGARLLEAMRRDGDASSRRIAAVALGEIAERAPETLPEDALSELRRVAAEARDPALRSAAERVARRLDAAKPPAPPQN